MNYNILRTKKIKTRTQITASAEHNLRLRSQHNIDENRSQLNMILVNNLDVDLTQASSLQEKLTDYYKKLEIKERSDNVLMLEFVVSASPDFFKGKKIREIKAWADTQVKFFEDKFGKQLQFAVLHLDEKTPHIHFQISTEFKSVKKYKNQKGEFFKENYSLNARRYDRQFLIDLHSEHAKYNEKYDLKRGIKGSMREHKTLKEFYNMKNKALNTDYSKKIEETIESLETSFLSNKVSIKEVREKFAPIINGVLKQNKTLKEKYLFDYQQLTNKLIKEQEKLEKKEKELEKIEINLKARSEVYREAINKSISYSKLIKELEDENKDFKKYKTIEEVRSYLKKPTEDDVNNLDQVKTKQKFKI